jgi:hypothetical protein
VDLPLGLYAHGYPVGYYGTVDLDLSACDQQTPQVRASLFYFALLTELFSHLENPDTDSFMKPWFWIILLLFGPIIRVLAFQWDILIGVSLMPL